MTDLAYHERTQGQFNDELEDYLKDPNPVIRDRAAQALCITREVLSSISRGSPDAAEYAMEMEPEIERRLQEIRAMVAPTLRSTDLTQKP